MIVFLLLATLLSQRAGALPMSAGPTTTPTIVHNVVFGVFARASCSDVRSMYEIVRSCLFTIAACVYRAIHTNIPDPKLSFWGKLRVTAKTTIYALIAPELMIWWALRQWFGAGIVVKEVNKLEPELKWTKTHGQFAQMGGFGRKDTKHILYPPTLIQLLKNGQIDIEELQLTVKEIDDKSKGDVLSKGLVAFQTTWFVFECLARLHQGLPIIELEVVTLAFATLNVITYALWWYKPLNVACPIYLHILPIQPNQFTRPASRSQESLLSAELEEDQLPRGEQGAELGQLKTGMVMKRREMVGEVATVVQDAVEDVVGEFKEDLREYGWFGTAGNWLIVKPFAAVAMPLGELLRDENVHDKATHVSTFYATQIPKQMDHWVVLPSSIIGIIFGGIHFLSWDSTFPTHVQLVLWRASSIVLVIQPFLVLLMDLFAIICNQTLSGSWREAVADFLHDLCTYLVLFGAIPYILARFCVLVIAFLTLRDLPLPAFTNVSWTAYIPHF